MIKYCSLAKGELIQVAASLYNTRTFCSDIRHRNSPPIPGPVEKKNTALKPIKEPSDASVFTQKTPGDEKE